MQCTFLDTYAAADKDRGALEASRKVPAIKKEMVGVQQQRGRRGEGATADIFTFHFYPQYLPKYITAPPTTTTTITTTTSTTTTTTTTTTN